MRFFSRLICLAGVVGVSISSAVAQQKLSREEYIARYQSLAIESMDVYGIPASIKMAQALFESDNGNSRLARLGNNHFGIKCKKDWTGETITHTDDAPDECFRKYATVEESYRDHSEFLDKSPRYQNLFKLDPTDYKGWAEGLQKDGYATNPNYAAQLIKIIEDNGLDRLDRGETIAEATKPAEDQTPKVEIPKPAAGDVIDIDNYAVSVQGANGGHTIYRNNGSLFLLVRDGDTPEALAAETGVSVKKLTKYNDLNAGSVVKPGDMLYIRPKAKRSVNGTLIHAVRAGETLHSISQRYGVRLQSLCNLNRRSKAMEVTEGEQIRLR